MLVCIVLMFTLFSRIIRYPEELADRSWDNVGLLLGNSDAEGKKPKVLVTNDLTWQVAQDAIKQEVCVIVSYRMFHTFHPPPPNAKLNYLGLYMLTYER